MKAEEFNSIRNKYIDARSSERAIMVDLLKENGYAVKTKGCSGSGRKKYTNGGEYQPPHDLRHHKWIEASKNNVNFLISLNPFEVDSNSGNPHHLYDRIGVQAYLGDNKESDIRTSMIITEWSLPINDDNSKDIIKFLEKIIEMFQVWMK